MIVKDVTRFGKLEPVIISRDTDPIFPDVVYNELKNKHDLLLQAINLANSESRMLHHDINNKKDIINKLDDKLSKLDDINHEYELLKKEIETLRTLKDELVNDYIHDDKLVLEELVYDESEFVKNPIEYD
jgi:hypothetical protein